MAREGFHPEYHDQSFYQGFPPGQDDDGGDKDTAPPGRLRAAAAKLRARISGFQGSHGILLPSLLVSLVLVVGYVMLPAGRTIGGPAGTTRAPASSPTLATVPVPAPTTGATVGEVRPNQNRERVLDVLAHAVGIGTRQVSATSPAWGETRSLDLFARTVTAEGKVVDAMPHSGALALLWLSVLGGFALGSGCGYLVDLVRSKGYIPEAGHETFLGRVVSGSVTLGTILLLARPAPTDLLVLASAAAVATLAARKRLRLRVLLATLGLASVGIALVVPVVAPHPALAGDYGRLGIYAGDMAACLCASVLASVLCAVAGGRPAKG